MDNNLVFKSPFPYKDLIVLPIAIISLFFFTDYFFGDKEKILSHILIGTIVFFFRSIFFYCSVNVYHDKLTIKYPFFPFISLKTFNKIDISKIMFCRVYFYGGLCSFYVEDKNLQKRNFTHLFTKRQWRKIIEKLNENGIAADEFP